MRQVAHHGAPLLHHVFGGTISRMRKIAAKQAKIERGHRRG
jgi:hypothetical protein